MIAGRVNRITYKFTAVLGTIHPKAWLSLISEWSTTSLQLFTSYTSATSPTADGVPDRFSVLGITAEQSHTLDWAITFLTRWRPLLTIEYVLNLGARPAHGDIDVASTTLYAPSRSLALDHGRPLPHLGGSRSIISWHVHTRPNITSDLRLLSIY